MYEFITGPLTWFTFIVFIAGCVFRLIQSISLSKKDQVIFPRRGASKSVESLSSWLSPYTRLNFMDRPTLTVVTTILYFCLVLTPVVLLFCKVLGQEVWNITCRAVRAFVSEITTAGLGHMLFLYFTRVYRQGSESAHLMRLNRTFYTAL